MSGAVSTTSDTSLPKQEPLLAKQPHDNIATSKHPQKSGKTIFFLTFRQINCLAIMIILAASNMVSIEDLAVFVFSAIYMYFLSKVAFPINNNSPFQQQPIFDPKSSILGLYILFAAVIGLFLPILYMFHGILEGDKDGIKAAAPHVFLLTSQVFMEGVSVSDRFSLPIRVFIPVFFNSCRLYTLKKWLTEEIIKDVEGCQSYARLCVGKALAVANVALWTYNLFGFLLPVYLPRSFKRYYSTNNDSSIKDDDQPK